MAWSPPDSNVMKFNVDGSALGQPGLMSNRQSDFFVSSFIKSGLCCFNVLCCCTFFSVKMLNSVVACEVSKVRGRPCTLFATGLCTIIS